MATKNLGRVLERVRKGRLEKSRLLKKFAFLKDIPFYSITRFQLANSEKKEYRVEFTRKNIKHIIEAIAAIDPLRDECKSLMHKVESLEDKLVKLKIEYSKLEQENKKFDAANNRLMKNCNEGVVPDDGASMPSPSQRLIEKGAKGKPIQGGAPGSGKRR